ncbi:MAG: glycerol kinase GlpK [Chloroflexia bacterium]|nr:glycerol kinase GlpK [Chloroflexia bacterium]
MVLALDQGTSSSRAIVFDREGAQVAAAQRPLAATFPRPGWVNQDAREIVATTLAAAREAISRANVAPTAISTIGIANQRETVVLWDRATGQPAAPAIVWQSRQSAPQVQALIDRGMGDRIQSVTGLVPDAYFSATKLVWLFETEPELRRRAEAGDLLFGTVETWLIWNLSSGARHVTDISNASRTMLLDLATGEWSDELLADLAIPRSILPRVVGNAEPLCTVEGDIFGGEITVTGSAGDQQAALFGHGCVHPGQAKNTYGTGSFLLVNVGSVPKPSHHRLLSTVAWRIGGETTYALEGAIFVTGAAVQWLRDGLGIIDDAAAVEPLAASVADSAGVVFVPALTGLGAPWWDASARGAVLGITRATTAGHLARATLEAIAFQTRDVVDAMAADAGVPLSELRVDGGASANDLLMQIQADVLGIPVIRPLRLEATALGAARLAAVGANLAPIAPSPDRTSGDTVFEPAVSRDERDSRYDRWTRAVQRAGNWEE